MVADALVVDRVAQPPHLARRPSKLWFFREHRFVKALRADLEADEKAKVAVRADTGAGTIRAKCKLTLKRDRQFGDFAGGKCKAA